MASSQKEEQSETSVWPKHIIKSYIDIMVDEVTKGSMNNGVFQPKVWNSMVARLNAKCQRNFKPLQIKQKFNRLRKQHRDFSQLLQHTGFGWDAETNTVTASEDIWKNYLVAHPEAAQFKKHGLEHYTQLGAIFNKSTATGVLHHASTQDPPNSDDEVRLESQYLRSGVHVNNENDEDDADDRGSLSTKRSTDFSDRKKRKEARSMQMGDAILAWAEASKARADAQRAKAERWRAKIEASDGTSSLSSFSVAACVAILNEMDLPNDTYVKAMRQFKESINRELFMAVPLERKRAWLDSL